MVLSVAFGAALVTWMVCWMRRTARKLSGELRGRLDEAVGLGPAAVVGVASPPSSGRGWGRRCCSSPRGKERSAACYQADPETGFVQVRRDLRLDAVNEYVQHMSPAVFACPAGISGPDDWWGRAPVS